MFSTNTERPTCASPIQGRTPFLKDAPQPSHSIRRETSAFISVTAALVLLSNASTSVAIILITMSEGDSRALLFGVQPAE